MARISLMRRVGGIHPLGMMLLCAGILLFTAVMCGIRVNLTASMPIGIYRLSNTKEIHRGDFVAVCLPAVIALQGLQHGYLKHGRCLHTNVIPVLKQVIALPHDWVQVTKAAIVVNGEINSAPQKSKDHTSKEISRQVILGLLDITDRYWLYGMNDPIHSWDSRYYGGVERTNIRGVYMPLWTFSLSRHLSTRSRQVSRQLINTQK